MNQEEKQWETALVDGRIANILRKMKLNVPLRHQSEAIKRLICKKDVLLATGTGSGKTLAYILPSIQFILQYQSSQQGNDHKLQCLIVEPTRELMLQTAELLGAICKRLAQQDVYINASYAGQAGGPGTPDIVVTTPGHITDYEYDHLVFISIDEADQIFAFEYRQQLEDLKTVIPQNCVKCLTSATLSRQVKDYASIILTEPLIIQEEEQGNNVGVNKRFFFTTYQTDIEKYYQLYTYFPLNVLQSQRTIIYTPFKEQGFRLHYFLNRFGTKALHYSPHFTMEARQNILQKYNSYASNILIISEQQVDSETQAGAIRGIDFDAVSVIILFSMPNTVEQFIHIVGRAGRGGNKATIISHLLDLDDTNEDVKDKDQQREWDRQKKILLELIEKGITMDYINFDIELLKREFGYRVKDVWSQMRAPEMNRYKQKMMQEMLLEDKEIKKHLQQNKRDQEMLKRFAKTSATLTQKSLTTIPPYLQEAANNIKAQLSDLSSYIKENMNNKQNDQGNNKLSYKQRSKLLERLQNKK